MPQPIQDWWTRQQAADYLQVGLETIDRWIKAGILDARKIGPAKQSTVRISAISIEKMLEKSKP